MQLPKDFIDRTKPLIHEEWDDFVDSLNQEPPVSIRVNRSKLSEELNLEHVAWCNTGYYLSQRPQFTFDPLFHAGVYYVQEASSMIIGQAIEQLMRGDVRCLDLCAAPGGKTTLISSVLSKDSLLVSNEIIRSRAYVLSENAMKWGNSNQVVTNNKSEDFSNLTHFFDVILVDAPCSGEGMFRKGHQAIEEWSVENVKLCAQRQKEILSNIWEALKPGGYLLYSTCTYNREENEEIVGWILDNYDAELTELDIKEGWGITKSEVRGKSTYRFFPHKTKGEGLYFAVLHKKDDILSEHKSKKLKNKDRKQKQKINISDFACYLKDIERFSLLENQGFISAIPKNSVIDIEVLQEKLNIISQGICLGQMKGKDFIPHQSLALNVELNEDAFPRVEVDWQTAIAYLRTESVNLSEAPKGIVLLTYENMPLGFVKNIGNRANNLYPNEWRIRSANLPQTVVGVLG